MLMFNRPKTVFSLFKLSHASDESFGNQKFILTSDISTTNANGDGKTGESDAGTEIGLGRL